MYDPDEEVRKALRACLQSAYTRQTDASTVPDRMQALLARLAERQPERSSSS